MRYPKITPIKIIMLGAGGTGSYIAMHLYRLLYCLDRRVRIIIADGDSVEKKNLIRQHFTAADLGQNKAKVLAERYASAFSMEAEYPLYSTVRNWARMSAAADTRCIISATPRLSNTTGFAGCTSSNVPSARKKIPL